MNESLNGAIVLNSELRQLLTCLLVSIPFFAELTLSSHGWLEKELKIAHLNVCYFCV